MSTKSSNVSRSKPEDMRVLVISHGHPDLSLGGAEVASCNLHKGLNDLEGVRSFFMARVGSPYPRHSASALMGHQGADDEILYFADDYDHFLLSNRNTDEIGRDLQRLVGRMREDSGNRTRFEYADLGIRPE